ncbi:hypothetical protein [Actinomadura atramentaria]|uniref:hypothetical protein n=1 Tax=Actinomadura atramentaria TaxID=1990 RepID=UPI00035F1067|nr:hypothetical protein [Actinomadura atramentaria]
MAFQPPSPQPPGRPPGAPWPPPLAPLRPLPPREPRRLGLTARQWAGAAFTLACCLLALTAVAAVAGWQTLHRPPTFAEMERAADAEVARRWSAWPADRVFPAEIAYRPDDEGRTATARRIGIAPDTACADAVDPAIAGILTDNGCRAALRATYADELGGVVTTVAVVAFPDAFGADRALKALPAPASNEGVKEIGPAVRAAAFPGTASALFTDAARLNRSQTRKGPYVVLTASGMFDGRPVRALTAELPGHPFVVAPQLGSAIARDLGERPLPNCRDGEWKC